MNTDLADYGIYRIKTFRLIMQICKITSIIVQNYRIYTIRLGNISSTSLATNTSYHENLENHINQSSEFEQGLMGLRD